MEAVFRDRWELEGVDVYLFERTPSGKVFYELEIGGAFESTRLVPVIYPQGNVDPAPTMFLKTAALDALVAAARPKMVVDDVTLEALDDVRGTRDRLLTLVEQLALAAPG